METDYSHAVCCQGCSSLMFKLADPQAPEKGRWTPHPVQFSGLEIDNARTIRFTCELCMFANEIRATSSGSEGVTHGITD